MIGNNLIQLSNLLILLLYNLFYLLSFLKLLFQNFLKIILLSMRKPITRALTMRSTLELQIVDLLPELLFTGLALLVLLANLVIFLLEGRVEGFLRG